MVWLVAGVFLVFIGGLAVVTIDSIRHASKKSQDKPIKPAQ
jgi:hypothetical protein